MQLVVQEIFMSKVKLPFDCVIYDAEPALVRNPFSGEGVVLTPEAIAVYDTIKGCEMIGDYKMMEKGLRWFRQYFPAEYMVLLD
jgi:hypothetical protein